LLVPSSLAMKPSVVIASLRVVSGRPLIFERT
jgi:hypothetical protein